MNIIHKSIKYVSQTDILIPFGGKIKSCIKSGNYFEKGDKLFEVEGRKLLNSYSLTEDLGIKAQKALDFVTRIEGEYVAKGDVLAERVVSGGFVSKKLIADQDGIVDLSKIQIGHINILSEVVTKSCVTTFKGAVRDIDYAKGVFVQTDICEMPLFFLNGVLNEGLFGNLKILTDSESIPSSKKLDASYEGDIVFAGRFLCPEIATELFKRGCEFILTGSMNYDDLKNLNLPIGILTGFGNVQFDLTRLDFIREIEGYQVLIPGNNRGVLQFPVGLNNKISRLIEQKYYTDCLQKGDIVRSRDIESLGLIGEVISFDEKGNFAKVLIQNEGEFTIRVENLELYTEEFSIVRTGVL